MGEAAASIHAAAAAVDAGMSGSREVPAIADAPSPAAAEGRLMRQPTSIAALAVALVLGSGGSAGVGALIGPTGPTEAAFADMKRDVEANTAKVGAVSTELGETEDGMLREQIKTQRWLGTQLIKQSTALSRIASKIGIEIDVSVDPLLPGGPN